MNNNKREITILNKSKFPKNLESICQNFFFPSVLSHCNKDRNHRPVLELNIWWLQLNILLSRQQIVYPKVGRPTLAESQPVLISPFYTFCLSSPGACLMQTRTNLGPTIYQGFPSYRWIFPLVPFFKGFFLPFSVF